MKGDRLNQSDELKLVINGRIPSKKNSLRRIMRGGRVFTVPSAQFEQWNKTATDQIFNQPKFAPFKPNAVNLEFYMPDARRTDLTNKAESIMDLLVDCGVIADDCWQVISEIVLKCNGIDRVRPRCEIVLKKGSECVSA